MEENKVIIEESEKVFPLWRVLYKSIWLILAVTIICGAIGITLGFLRSTPTYTASRKILLNVDFDTKGSTSEATAVVNNNTLAKRTLPTIADIIKTRAVVDRANSYGHGGEINSKQISVTYSEKSLIFTISYTDLTEAEAVVDLEDVVKAANEVIKEKEPTVFTSLEFVETQNVATVTKNTNIATYIILGFVGGLVLGVVLALLIFILDNKVKDGYELEEITGSSVIAIIEKNS
ncbi:MAG: hypothetical protein E7369_01080 [Clostridiales bacterium]|nr:hypothetical protein [Clostridiales bacterium]